MRPHRLLTLGDNANRILAAPSLEILPAIGDRPATMKVATWNVNGIRARQADVLGWMASERPDVVCLQELKALPEQIPASLREMEGYWSYWHGGPKGYSGVSLHVRKELAPECPEFSHPDFDHEHRIVVVQIGRRCIASVYVPNGGKDFAAKVRFLEALTEYAEVLRRSGAELLICGDVNIARAEIDVHPSERKAVIGQLPEERALFERILSEGGLTDVGRALAPGDERMFSWWAPWRSMRARNVGWRLDYILASEGLARRAVSCPVEAAVGSSDHAPVVATFG